jgi:predicted NACHT family NTPase
MEVTRTLLQSSRLVILCGPGSGETTLVWYLALTFALDKMPHKYVRTLAFAHRDQRMDNLVPILVGLPRFAESDRGSLLPRFPALVGFGGTYHDDTDQAAMINA